MKKYPAFEAHKIPYQVELTSRFVKYLMEIAECKPFLDEALATPLKVTLLRQAKLKSITYSNQIEGNTLTEKQVTELLTGEKPKKASNEQKEILNYETAISFASRITGTDQTLTKQDFFNLQKLITEDQIDPTQSGRPRTVPVSIVNEDTKTVIDICPEPLQLNLLLAELWEWLQETEKINPYARAFAFHLIAVAIHPFADGNGRTVRLCQQILLQNSGENIAEYIPTETAIMRNRREYYLSIRESRATQTLAPMMEFLAKCYSEAARDVVKAAKKLFEDSKRKDAGLREKMILTVAKKLKSFKISEVASALPDFNSKTLQRDIQSMVKRKVLSKKGQLKGTRYQIIKK